MSKTLDQQELRSTLLLILNAAETRMNASDFLQHPLLKDHKLDPRKIGVNLGFLAREKLVRKYKDKTYAAIHMKEDKDIKVAERSASSKIEVCLMFNPTQGTMILDIGGIKLPILLDTTT